jgi:chromosome segregation ATPase
MDPEERDSPYDRIEELAGKLAAAERNAETWSARVVEAESKLTAAQTEARNNYAAASSWMDQHAGLAKRMIDVQAENKRLHEQAIENAREYNTMRDNFAASMRRADAAQAVADRNGANVIEREKEIAALKDKVEQLTAGRDELDQRIGILFGERDHHMKRCDELVRLARDTNKETSGRIESLQLEIEDALLVVQEQSHDIVGLVKAVSRAEREVQELRSRRAKGE